MITTPVLPSWLCAMAVAVAPIEGVAESPTTEPETRPRTSADDRYDALIREFTERFTAGNDLVARGAYLQAAREYERAFAAFPASDALYNASLAYERGGDSVAAARAARRYLQLPACDADTERDRCAVMVDEVTQTLGNLMRQIGELRLDVGEGVELARVRVDGRVVPVADFPVLLAPGSIDVELVGREPGQKRVRSVVLRPGESQAIYVGPFDKPEPAVPVRVGGDRSQPDKTKPPGYWAPPVFWTSLSLTIASGCATGLVAGITRANEKKFEAHFLGDGKFEGDYDVVAERRFHRLQATTNALVGVTAGFAVLAVVTGVIALTRGRRAERTAGSRAQLTWSGLQLRF